MDKVVHFEIPAEDTNRASEFYKKTFDWGITPMSDMNYTIAHTVEVDDQRIPKESGAINGGFFVRSDDLKNPIITLNVDSIDESLKTVSENGGFVVREKVAVGDMGFVAYFKDTEGNVLGLWENSKK